MDRRSFCWTAAAACGWVLSGGGGGSSGLRAAAERPTGRSGTFALDGHRIRFTHPAILKPWKMLMLADTHLFREDERDAEYRPFSARMAAAYNHTQHFETGQPTDPETCFQETLKIAQAEEASLVALVGDILSFPSHAAVDWVQQRLQAAGLPHLYVAGNHDWHYEGLPGTLAELRATWIRDRLQPLYAAHNPLMMTHEAGGVRIVAIDNSNYQITDEQLDYFRNEINTGSPLLLLVHIPLYAPLRPVGFGCGHPDWGSATDENYELERRERWPESGHSATTFEFHRLVFSSPQVLGVLAGHIHRPSVDIVNGTPQVVTGHNATGAHLQIEFQPGRG